MLEDRLHNYVIVPVPSLNNYLYNGKSEIKVIINNSSENSKKKKYCVPHTVITHLALSFSDLQCCSIID